MTPSRFKTSNLSLASFLAYRDQPYKLVRGEGKIASWEFDREQVGAMVDAFEDGVAAVEPQAYFYAATRTRKLLFSFLAAGVDDPVWDEDQVTERLTKLR